MNAATLLHDAGQSLWLDNITRDLLDDGTLARYIDELVDHRADVEPDDLRQGDQRQRRLRRADRRAHARGDVGRRRCSSSWRWTTCARAADLFRADLRRDRRRRRLGLARGLAAARARHRRHDRGRPSALHAQAARPNLFIKIPGTPAGHPRDRGVDLRRRAGQRHAAVLAPSTTWPPPRRTCAASSAGSRPGSTSTRRVGRVAVRQPLGRRRRPARCRRAPQPARHRRRQARLPGLSRAARLRPLAEARAPGARPQRLLWASTGTKDPNAARHALCRGARRAGHHQHDAREDPARVRRARRRSATCCRPTAATPSTCSPARPAGVDVAEPWRRRSRREGADAFVKSWNDLLAAIESKSPIRCAPRADGRELRKAPRQRSDSDATRNDRTGTHGRQHRAPSDERRPRVRRVRPQRPTRSSTSPTRARPARSRSRTSSASSTKPRAVVGHGAGGGRRTERRRSSPTSSSPATSSSTAATPTTATTSTAPRALAEQGHPLRRRRHQRRRVRPRARLLPDDRRRRRASCSTSTRSSPRSPRASTSAPRTPGPHRRPERRRSRATCTAARTAPATS